jgi:hypothetical protein
MCLSVSLQASAQELRYDIIRNGKVIGWLVSRKSVHGKSVELATESAATVEMLLTLKFNSMVRGTFSDGLLTEGSILRRVNGQDKANIRFVWENDHYVMQDGKSRTELRARISYSTACLMFYEPVKLTRIFSENFKQFIPINPGPGPHEYILHLPDGNTNLYTYENGICTAAEINTTFSTAYFRLRK